mgnify:CR=1 FL=1
MDLTWAQWTDGSAIRVAPLAVAIHRYDSALGYPMAWYFMMLSGKTPDHAIASAILADQEGEYDYLPERDIAVLTHWAREPYAV